MPHRTNALPAVVITDLLSAPLGYLVSSFNLAEGRQRSAGPCGFYRGIYMIALLAAITTATVSEAVTAFVGGATLGAEAAKTIKKLKD